MLRSAILAPVLALGLLCLPGLAAAHEPSPGPNGGLTVDAGDGHAELVLNGTTTVTVYLFDANEVPVSADGWTGQATLILDGAAQRFPLAGQGMVLKGEAPAAVPAGTKGALRLTGPAGQTAVATY